MDDYQRFVPRRVESLADVTVGIVRIGPKSGR
jgi:hypothetical protein